jgi:hypothetical protein
VTKPNKRMPCSTDIVLFETGSSNRPFATALKRHTFYTGVSL